MEITYMIIIAIITYIFGAITKLFIRKVPNKYIPIQNVLIGVISGFICFFCKIEPNLLQALVLCLIASTSAGGIADIKKIREEEY